LGKKRKRLSGDERLSHLLEVARLFYDKGLSKTEISHKIETSTTQVARLLEEARNAGIVKFEYAPPALALGRDLQRRYPDLKEVIVFPGSENYDFERKMRGQSLANYFDQYLTQHPRAKIAVGGGDTMFHMAMALPQRRRDIEIYPVAIIGRGPILWHVDPMTVITLMSLKSAAYTGAEQSETAHYVTVLPPRAKSKEENSKTAAIRALKDVRNLLKNPIVSEVYNRMKKVDIIITTVGPISRADPKFTDVSRHSTVHLLEDMVGKEWLKGAVGTIHYAPFDKDGNTKPEWEFFPMLGVNDIRKMVEQGKKVVLTTSRYVANGLRAVLNGKLCNVLIIDHVTAEKVLSE
jgi:DNA-binding transcriptional regulator LsrR (DeoR family)